MLDGDKRSAALSFYENGKCMLTWKQLDGSGSQSHQTDSLNMLKFRQTDRQLALLKIQQRQAFCLACSSSPASVLSREWPEKHDQFNKQSIYWYDKHDARKHGVYTMLWCLISAWTYASVLFMRHSNLIACFTKITSRVLADCGKHHYCMYALVAPLVESTLLESIDVNRT